MSFLIKKERYKKNLMPKFPAWAIINCPGCGKESTLSHQNHRVTADGTVSPSYVCPFPPCTFHEFVKLEGWEP